jgi:hypothetical protein
MLPTYDVSLNRKKSFVANLRQYPALFQEGVRNFEKKNCHLSSVLTRIRNWHLQNKCLNYYLFNQLAHLYTPFLLGDYECVCYSLNIVRTFVLFADFLYHSTSFCFIVCLFMLFSEYCAYVCAVRWLFISFYKCLFYCLSVYVILWILCVRLCYSLTFYIILQVFVLLSVCLCYCLNIYVIFWLFVLLSECSLILWMFMLIS